MKESVYQFGNFRVSFLLKRVESNCKKDTKRILGKISGFRRAIEILKSWFQEAEKGVWPNPNFVKNQFPNSRVIPKNRVIFNIRGNHYRLLVRINDKYQMLYVRFIGTHP